MNANRDLLSRQQALHLLAGMATGRVVYTAHALPAVLPVRCSLTEDGSLLLDAHAPADLLRAAESGVIAFETGEIDQLDGKGWSVTVLGHAKVITRMEGLMPARGPAAPADVEPAGRTVIRLHPELVTGRSIGVSPRSG